jgi:hypothetical protein
MNTLVVPVNIAADALEKYAPNGKLIVTFVAYAGGGDNRLAFSCTVWGEDPDKNDGNVGHLANVARGFKRGDWMILTGRIKGTLDGRTRVYVDKSGVTRAAFLDLEVLGVSNHALNEKQPIKEAEVAPDNSDNVFRRFIEKREETT